MRTARLLPVSLSMHCSQGVPSRGGVPAWGVYLPGGVLAQVLPPPPWTEFLTHATENITLPKTSFTGGNNVPSHSWCQSLRHHLHSAKL